MRSLLLAVTANCSGAHFEETLHVEPISIKSCLAQKAQCEQQVRRASAALVLLFVYILSKLWTYQIHGEPTQT